MRDPVVQVRATATLYSSRLIKPAGVVQDGAERCTRSGKGNKTYQPISENVFVQELLHRQRSEETGTVGAQRRSSTASFDVVLC